MKSGITQTAEESKVKKKQKLFDESDQLKIQDNMCTKSD